ncbi:RPL7AB, partial [Symbiodinium sp. KB8]
PEDKATKKERLTKFAQAKADGKDPESGPAPSFVKFGLNHVTYLIEQKKAKLVLIANDVDPIELVVWLPALCRKMDVPYMIVANKGRLGTLVRQKKAAAVCLTSVDEDKAELQQFQELARSRFNTNVDSFRRWGGGIMGLKTQEKLRRREVEAKKESNKKL